MHTDVCVVSRTIQTSVQRLTICVRTANVFLQPMAHFAANVCLATNLPASPPSVQVALCFYSHSVSYILCWLFKYILMTKLPMLVCG